MSRIVIGEFIEGQGHRIFVDGAILDELCYKKSITVNQDKSYELLSKCSVDDFFDAFERAEIELRDLIDDTQPYVHIPTREDICFKFESISLNKVNDAKRILIYPKFDFMSWKFDWSVREFLDIFSSVYLNTRNSPFDYRYLEDLDDEGLLDYDFGQDVSLVAILSDEFHFSCLGDMVNHFVGIVSDVHDLTIQTLISHPFLEFFDFPEEVRTACIQYLQYFAEFLKEVGIKAKVALTEQDSGEVLFSVTPKDKDEAISKIREALRVYLQLPKQEPDFPTQPDPNIQILYAQITNLRNQVMLKATALEHQRATIQLQESTIQNQKLTVDGLVSFLFHSGVLMGAESESTIEIEPAGLANVERNLLPGKIAKVGKNLAEEIRKLKEGFYD